MKKVLILSLLAIALFVAACTSGTENNSAQDDINTQTTNIDVTNDGDNDVSLTTTGNNAEVIIDMDEVLTENVPEVENYCIPGSTYKYSSNEGNSDSTVIGFESYKGKTWCKAESTTEINSPIGTITTKTTYYFDNTYKEYWVLTTTNTPDMATQTNEVHIVDGEVQ